jgi:DNA (cytosine-5)-methyltransferase 1
MRFGSVCSGIEAASVAWHPLGWQAAWLAEIEPFPAAVLRHHYPEAPNLGDMTTLPDRIRSGEIEAPDLFCGGTPCQAFSVAGLRRSLDDARGNLSLTFCEIADAIDSVRLAGGKPASIVFWENVPGVLSTADNAFGCFLGALAGCDTAIVPSGRWTDAGLVAGPQRTVAWRVLDAQFFGLAQRRRRVFVVASARDGFNPAAVLFEWEGLRRDTPPSREAGQSVAPCVTAGAANGGAAHGARSGSAKDNLIVPVGIDFQNASLSGDIAGTLDAEGQKRGNRGHGVLDVSMCLNAGGQRRLDAESETLIPTIGGGFDVAHSLRGEGFDASEDGTGRGTPLVPVGIFQDSEFGVAQYDSAGTLRAGRIPEHQMVMQPVALQDVRAMSKAQNGRGWNADGTAYTVDTHATQGVAVAMVNMQGSKGNAVAQADGPSFTLNAMHGHDVHAIVAPTITATNDPSRSPQSSEVTQQVAAVHSAAMQVRRLTPVECERLQGFPDGYTAIPWRKKPASECPDGPRYKALGNSWAVPVVRWIGRRINERIGNE